MTRLGCDLIERVSNVIRSQFNLDEKSKISVRFSEIDWKGRKIYIALRINTTADPVLLAKSYFGLTGKVREALGPDWAGFFPVITPQIINENRR